MRKYTGELEKLKEFGFKYDEETHTWYHEFYYDEDCDAFGRVWVSYKKQIIVDNYEGEVTPLYNLITRLKEAGLVEEE